MDGSPRCPLQLFAEPHGNRHPIVQAARASIARHGGKPALASTFGR
jgi:hypothetical protein